MSGEKSNTLTIGKRKTLCSISFPYHRVCQSISRDIEEKNLWLWIMTCDFYIDKIFLL